MAQLNGLMDGEAQQFLKIKEMEEELQKLRINLKIAINCLKEINELTFYTDRRREDWPYYMTRQALEEITGEKNGF